MKYLLIATLLISQTASAGIITSLRATLQKVFYEAVTSARTFSSKNPNHITVGDSLINIQTRTVPRHGRAPVISNSIELSTPLEINQIAKVILTTGNSEAGKTTISMTRTHLDNSLFSPTKLDDIVLSIQQKTYPYWNNKQGFISVQHNVNSSLVQSKPTLYSSESQIVISSHRIDMVEEALLLIGRYADSARKLSLDRINL